MRDRWPEKLQILRHIHLAFKHSTPSGRMDPEEIYGILLSLFLLTLSRYDPDYTDKCFRLCELIDHEHRKRIFQADFLSRKLGFDCTRHLRLLVGRGLEQAQRGRRGAGPRLGFTGR